MKTARDRKRINRAADPYREQKKIGRDRTTITKEVRNYVVEQDTRFCFYYGEKLAQKLGCHVVGAADISLMPNILKK